MARVFITGSSDGLGRNAAQSLIAAGHEVVLHARSPTRASALGQLWEDAAGLVIGDLSIRAETEAVAAQVNEIGLMDAVIHNAGVFSQDSRGTTIDGHATTLAVNTLAPYILTALIDRPARLIYLSSGMHRSGTGSLDDIDWEKRSWNASQAYCESKMHVTALAGALARIWPGVLSNAVDPGWVPTKMGGAGAPDDLAEGHRTQVWLATSSEPEAQVTGRYWHHRTLRTPAAEASDPGFQKRLLARLSDITGLQLAS